MWMIDDPFSFDYFFPFSSRRQLGPAFLDRRYQIILLYLPEDSNEQVIGLPRFMSIVTTRLPSNLLPRFRARALCDLQLPMSNFMPISS
jgi:hypothetical protein